MIVINKLAKRFGNKQVLNNLNLEIERGETMVIIGQSGCGKSVLLKHIIGILQPDEGEIIIDGFNVAEFSEQEMSIFRRRFGMLFQGAALFDSMTVGENISFALKKHTSLSQRTIDRIVSNRLEMVGLPGIKDLYPSEISGGMAKRVGLARAISMDPEIILYDEPTTGLDPVMVTKIDELINRLKDELKVTSIVVTHDMRSTHEIADRVAMHYNGKIVEVGTQEEIFKSENPIVKQFINGLVTGPIKDI